jgi:hypothetical protein
MYNYFKIRQYRKHIENLNVLMREYWDSIPRQQISDGHISNHGDSEKSLKLRKDILHLLPYVTEDADALHISHRMSSYPAPVVGGPIITIDIFDAIVEPKQGHHKIDQRTIIDCVEKAISTAKKREKEALRHWLYPWNWLIDGFALIIRLPFVILRRAGLPPKIEENIISQVIKIISLIIIVGYIAYKGLKIDVGTLLKFL